MLRIAEAQVSPTLRQIVITSISNMQKTSLGNIRRTKRLIQWGAFIGLLAVIISFVGCAEKEAKALEIVRDGQPQAEIVVATDAISSVRLAAEDLQKYVAQISGATLPIVASPSGKEIKQIYVGDSPQLSGLGVKVDGLPPEGFRIVARENFIALVGRDEQREPFPYDRRVPGSEEEWQKFSGQPSGAPGVNNGLLNRKLGFRTMDATATLYAVCEFLEQLGVRWYAPYEDGTVVPEKKTLSVASQDITMAPKFPYRDFSFYNTMRDDAEGVLWFKRMKFGASHTYANDAHSIRDILGSEQIRASHPEYYAKDAQGKPLEGHNGGVPKLSDPGFQAASQVFVNKAFDAYPSLKSMTLGMPDGFTKIDAEDAKKWVKSDATPDNVFSDYVWAYWLKMAEDLKVSKPGKFLNCYSYTTYSDPPSNIEKLPDNIGVTMSYGADYSMLPLYTNGLTLVRDKWLSMLTSGKFFMWEYCLYYRKNRPHVPVVFTKLLQKDMQRMNGVCEGKFIEVMPWEVEGKGRQIAYPALTHMIHYLQGKLYWNPDLNLQALLDEYYKLYYGPAQAEMKEFYEFAEEVWTRPDSRSVTPTTGFLKDADVKKYFELLSRAKSRVTEESIYHRRIARLETEMSPLKSFFDRLQRSGPAFIGRLGEPPANLDGNLKKPLWEGGEWYDMRELTSGHPLPDEIRTRVAFRLSSDKKTLFIGVDCAEPSMDKVKTTAQKQDDPAIFDDDAIEVYLESPERSFFKIVVNPSGLVYDESHDSTIVTRDTMPILWAPGTRVAVEKGARGWSAEIAIPTADLGDTVLGPQKSHPWGVNVCRMRRAGNEAEAFAIAPTGTNQFGVLNKLGSLTMPRK